jgi:putative membrane-bound dehydrogenase-like protein
VSASILLSRAGAQDAASDPSPESALRAFQFADNGLVVEPVATEPNVIDPVAAAWDEDGNLYVVEMRDYPANAPGGAIRYLTDGDGDGVYDASTLFAEDLPFPTSVLPWKGGVIVLAAPDLLYLRDTNHDGVADERRVLFSGFGQGLPFARANGLYWGLDNWIYAANGGSGGIISRPDAPAALIAPLVTDFRFRPDASAIEAVAGLTQFGACQDEWGNRFVSWHASPIRQAMVRQVQPAGAPSSTLPVDTSILEQYDTGRIWPISKEPQPFAKLSRDYFSSASGLTVYTGHALAAYAGDAFVCEPRANLLHRRILGRSGVALEARRRESRNEFLASTDVFFRPIQATTGPDGALYIVDFCREWFDHPDSAPADVRDTIDWRSGDTLGRIWRVRQRTWNRASLAAPKFSGATDAQLVEHLADPNGWVRAQVQRLLVERQATGEASALKERARSSTLPQARIRALWILNELGLLDDQTLAAAFGDADGNVRREAVHIAEPRLPGSPTLLEALSLLAEDPDVAVQYQLLQSARVLPLATKLAICKAVAATERTDPWLNSALAAAAGDDGWALLDEMLRAKGDQIDWWAARYMDLAASLAERIGASKRSDEIAALLQRVSNLAPATGIPDVVLLAGLSRGLLRAGEPLKQWLTQPPPGLDPATVDALQRAFISAGYLAYTADAALPHRCAAVRLLAEKPGVDTTQELLAMLTPDQQPEIVSTIVNVLGERGGEDTNQALLARWPSLPKPIRSSLVARFIASSTQTAMLLDALEQGGIVKHEINLKDRQALLTSADPAVRERAEALYPRFTSPAKADLYGQYAGALTLPADARRGAQHFAMNCFPCHQVHGIGNTVGPELSAAASKSKEELLRTILDPSAEVLPEYINYTISTKNFEDFGGLMVAEDSTSVTLRAAGGLEQAVQRADIEQIAPSAMSLMPEGLEAAVDRQAMADLIEFVQHPDVEALRAAAAQLGPAPE